MARKRTHQQQRSNRSSGVGSERSYYEYLVSAPAHRISRGELLRVIKGGEDTYLELKVRFSNVEKLVAEIIALSNTDGGAIVFGVSDQLRIEGVDDPEDVEEQLRELCARQIQPPILPLINKIAFDNGRRIVVLEVRTANRPHRTLDDRFYLREGAIKRETTREELSRLYEETHLTRFEQVPVLGAVIATDIDESLFWSYVRGVNPGPWGDSRRGFPTEEVMLEMGLATRIGEALRPTMGGLMLFGKAERIQSLLPRHDLLLTRYSGDAPESPVVETRRCHGNLLHLFEQAWHFLESYVDLHATRPPRRALQDGQQTPPAPNSTDHASNSDNAARAEVKTAGPADDGVEPFLSIRANYDQEAMREALVNLLVHRDWGARDRHARINIYDRSIELINPAQPLELPFNSIRYGISAPANPRMKAVFTNEHYGIPAVAGGVGRLLARARDFARRAPEGPTLNYGEFRIKFHGLL